MAEKLHQFGQRVISGQVGGPIGATLRGALGLAEPVYRTIVRARNAGFDSGRRESRWLGRPTISIGNITTGGTGKTPMVRWVCESLARHGIRPAVLMRGYRSEQTGGSDEQRMLEALLTPFNAIVEANPDRVAGAAAVLDRAQNVKAFVLDDGFQHRRARRILDIVLISAMEPFGYGHLLPRGLLREPLAGLKRAGAIVITHARQLDEPQLYALKQRLRSHYSSGPIYHADHIPLGFRAAGTEASKPVDYLDDKLQHQPVLAFCGLGDPRGFRQMLLNLGARIISEKWFPDHHAYTPSDLKQLCAQAESAGAKFIVTTEKDWTKLQRFPARVNGAEILRLDVGMRFWWDDESLLLNQMMNAMSRL